MQLDMKGASYSGGMYPNVPTSLVGIDVLPTSVSFVKPKSATYKTEFTQLMSGNPL